MNTLSINFQGNTISLKNTNEPTIMCQDLDNIFMAIRRLHRAHLKKMRTLDFEPNTKEFLLVLIKEYVNDRTSLIREGCNINTHAYNNWRNLLTGIVTYIISMVDISREKLKNYSYNIKTIKTVINIEKHTITTIIKNIETGQFLEATVFFREHIILSKNIPPKDRFSIEIIVNTKLGVIRFESID